MDKSKEDLLAVIDDLERRLDALEKKDDDLQDTLESQYVTNDNVEYRLDLLETHTGIKEHYMDNDKAKKILEGK